jgi:hypothetical protein
MVALDRAVGTLVVAGFAGISVTMTVGGQLYQKYFEMPVAALALMAICALAANGAIERRWPLVTLAMLQVMLTIALVVKPIIGAM